MTAFTICSNNYLPKARVLASSLKAGSAAAVCLVVADEPSPAIDYGSLGFDEVIFPEALPIPDLQWMKEHYDIIEFNTALKPFAFQHLMAKGLGPELYYFDPDIKVYQPLEAFSAAWAGASVVLTPHVLSPLPFDGLFPGENLFLNHGSFNLGFIGLRNNDTGRQLVQWWAERMAQHCIIDLRDGYFVDQIWCNLVPLYWPGQTAVCRHTGWNAAYWNLHERQLSVEAGGFRVNGEPLFFYHFSSFDSKLENLSPVPDQARYSFTSRPDMLPLYEDYKKDVARFEPARFADFRYFGGRFPVVPPPLPFYRRVARKLQREITNQIKK